MGPTTDKRNLRLGDNAVEVQEVRTQKKLCQAGVGAGRLLESLKNLFKNVRHEDSDHATGADTAWDDADMLTAIDVYKVLFQRHQFSHAVYPGHRYLRGPSKDLPCLGMLTFTLPGPLSWSHLLPPTLGLSVPPLPRLSSWGERGEKLRDGVILV